MIKLGSLALPAVIAAWMAAIVVVSLAGVAGTSNGWPQLLAGGLLSVPAVWRGQIWRLLTFALFDTEPLSLLMSCLMLYWFGRDLAGLWGGQRFTAVLLSLAIASGALTCVVGRLWRPASLIAHAGAAPVLDGLLVAWGLLFSTRVLRLFGLLRVTGRVLIAIVVAGTLVYACFDGLARFVPNLAAELLVLLWLGLLKPWRRQRRARRMALAARGEAWTFSHWYDRERRRPR